MSKVAAWLVCLAAVALSMDSRAADIERAPAGSANEQQQPLAVIVPAYRDDLQQAVSSLERRPIVCSSLTQVNADLVLYYAEDEEDEGHQDDITSVLESISQGAGRCFARTRTVYTTFDQKKEGFYPKGPSVQFYNMFLDQDVRAQLMEYEALAIVKGDVLVAAVNPFEELYKAAFDSGEDFWVKGNNVGRTNFDATAEVQAGMNVVGPINDNTIYNNNDPDFVEYVGYTRTRWEYDYPYDVALWLTVSDIPWPLQQGYASKFVTTNLVDDETLANGKAMSEQARNRRQASVIKHNRSRNRRLRGPEPDGELERVCTSACGSERSAWGLPEGTSTVCDDTCNGDHPRFGGFLCGAGDSEKYGSMCRLCFHDVDEARNVQRLQAENSSNLLQQRVIMCDSMNPPSDAVACSSECTSNTFTVCDDSCGTGRHGDYNCKWKDYGAKCRFCFNDVEAALAADEIAKSHGGRVIMCSTMEPPLEAEMIKLKPDKVLTA